MKTEIKDRYNLTYYLTNEYCGSIIEMPVISLVVEITVILLVVHTPTSPYSFVCEWLLFHIVSFTVLVGG